MGKNNGNSWLNAVKKAFRSPVNDDEKRSSRRREGNDKEEKKRGRRRWIFRKNIPRETTIQHNVAKSARSSAVTISTVTSVADNLVAKQLKVGNSLSEQKRAIAMATVAAEAAIATAEAAVEIIRLTRPSLFVKEHRAAVVIQTIFRGYLARRALLALKGVVKLQALIRGHNVRKRAKMTLQCIQSLVRVQAQVCDQRRRLSCEATSFSSMFNETNSSRNSTSGSGTITSNNLEAHPHALEEIKALIQKAKECSLKHRKTLAHALSLQTWTLNDDDEDQFSDKNYEDLEEQEHSYSCKKTSHPCIRKDQTLCNQTDPIRTLEIDTSRPYSFTSLNSRNSHFTPSINSPKTPSSLKIKSHLESPRCQNYSHRMSMSDNSCPLPRPNYMAATASAMARVRSHSTPRQRGSSPSREQDGSVKKRLSFPVPDGYNGDDKVLNVHRYKGICEGQFGKEQRSNVPYYYTD
ncbi:hypothetical protein CDL12_04359 [Handroanthus impetiginosus]|uniref:DUF4005 domain-containing protein n=1 Tax=Handroanthus impetiginosus TaxID=429701 RepID=A0A2G9HZI7_9LAMI|nr:hypothetical protein CDL12_04359 [Handroanthus impetiginosus]